ncbi:glycoside hydrolase [Verrucomicrobiales bacterium]|nr:glycoside hydrolase [Verrucomicrobiales bacterium]MDB4358704.1 glycoside hydrolase [Verrucomicrobiales bacterium]
MFQSSAFLCLLLSVFAVDSICAEPVKLPFEIEVETILTREDPASSHLWFHPRIAVIPNEEKSGNPEVVMTLQKLLGKSDFFSGLSVMTSRDLGKTWSEPTSPPELGWMVDEKVPDVSIAVADVTPGYHAGSGVVLAVGAQVRYSKEGKQLTDQYRSHQTAYAVLGNDGAWKSWAKLEMPKEIRFDFARSACAQWVEERDGTVLLPFYVGESTKLPFSTTMVRCSFDGETLRYLEHGNLLELETMRGLYEPSLVYHGDRYYVTMRNDHAAYVASSDDGLTFSDPKKWLFDDGEELGSYNTQAHWLESGGALFLTYTRKGANNDHVVRHRAPIFVAQVDPEKLVVIRETEKIVVPERGATLGNFGVVKISENESWVTVGEGNVSAAAKILGANGSVFLSRVRAGKEADVSAAKSAESIRFSVMGCGPYTPLAERALAGYIGQENEEKTSEFLVHVGDLVTGKAKQWKEGQFIKVANLLKNENQIPTFIVPGDNEWTDHADPDTAWSWWEKHYMHLDKNWDTSAFAPIRRQEVRPENFAFTHKGILFIGINKVGGKVYDEAAWKSRLKEDGDWVQQQLVEHAATNATVIFAQASAAGTLRDFVKVLIPAAQQYAKPILYIHADLHNWVLEEKQWADNITRLQLETIDEVFPPVQVSIDGGENPSFYFDRRLEDENWKIPESDGKGVAWAVQGGGEGNDKIRGITATADGGVLVTGEITEDCYFGGHELECKGALDFFAAKIDSGGRVMWATSAGGPGIDRGYSVAAGPDDSCIVTGHFESERFVLGEMELESAGDYDGFVARFNKKGVCTWARRFGGAGYDYGHGIVGMKGGGFVVSGAITGTGTFRDMAIEGDSRKHAVLGRISPAGRWLWAKGIGAASISGHQVTVGAYDSIYLAGYSKGKVTWSKDVETQSAVQDIFVANFDEAGNFQWVRNAGGKSDGVATSIAVDEATGNVAIAGMFKAEATFGEKTFTSQGGHDFFTAVFSGLGEPLGASHGAGEGTDYGLDIVSGDGGFVATGEFSDVAEFAGQTLKGGGERDAWVAKIAADGSGVEVIKVLGGTDNDLSYCVATTTDGAAVVAGAFRNVSTMGTTTLESAGGNDLFITKVIFDDDEKK